MTPTKTAQETFEQMTPQEFMLNPQLHAWFVENDVQECFKNHPCNQARIKGA